MRSPTFVGINDSDFHVTHVPVPGDPHARRVGPRDRPRHAPNAKIIAFDAHAVRQSDPDLTQDRRYLDVRCPWKKSRLSKIESNAAKERPDPEALGKLPVSGAIDRG